jgi:predicted nucleic acid-binding protein
MIYLDTNVIVYAIENHPKYGKSCKNILLDIESGKLEVSSSIFILVELIGALSKVNKILSNEKKAMINVEENINAVLSYPITWHDLNFIVIRRASEYKYKIRTADYIHIATIELNGINEIISADSDFDEVKFIERIDPLGYK